MSNSHPSAQDKPDILRLLQAAAPLETGFAFEAKHIEGYGGQGPFLPTELTGIQWDASDIPNIRDGDEWVQKLQDLVRKEGTVLQSRDEHNVSWVLHVAFNRLRPVIHAITEEGASRFKSQVEDAYACVDLLKMEAQREDRNNPDSRILISLWVPEENEGIEAAITEAKAEKFFDFCRVPNEEGRAGFRIYSTAYEVGRKDAVQDCRMTLIRMLLREGIEARWQEHRAAHAVDLPNRAVIADGHRRVDLLYGFAVDLKASEPYVENGLSRQKWHYRVWLEDELLFVGDERNQRYISGPAYRDEESTLEDIIGFCSLTPGDTDDEFFRDYTDRQLAFTQSAACNDLQDVLNDRRAEPDADEREPESAAAGQHLE